MSGDIFIDIDSIVLRGLHHVDPDALRETLQRALTDQLSAQCELSTIDMARAVTNITLPNDVRAEQLGQILSQSLSGIISNNDSAAKVTHRSTDRGQRDA